MAIMCARTRRARRFVMPTCVGMGRRRRGGRVGTEQDPSQLESVSLKPPTDAATKVRTRACGVRLHAVHVHVQLRKVVEAFV